jgi:hypothetical protein
MLRPFSQAPRKLTLIRTRRSFFLLIVLGRVARISLSDSDELLSTERTIFSVPAIHTVKEGAPGSGFWYPGLGVDLAFSAFHIDPNQRRIFPAGWRTLNWLEPPG